MTIYFLLYILLLGFYIVSSKKNQPVLFALTTIIVVFLLGFRSKDVGADTWAYVECWTSTNFIYRGEKTDWGFEQLLRILRAVSDNEGFFLFSTSVISLFGVILIIRKYSLYRYDSLLFFLIGGAATVFFIRYFSMVRQACAISFVLISFVCLWGIQSYKRFIYFVILFTIAVFIHGSCLVVLPFVILCLFDFRLKKSILFITLILSYIVGALQIVRISSLFSIVDLGDSSFDKYGGYTVEEMTFGNSYTPSIISMTSLVYTLICLYIIKYNDAEKYNVWYYKLFYFGTILNNLLVDNMMWDRLLLYFTMLSILVIPNLVKSTPCKYSKYIYYFLIIFYFRKSINMILFMSQLPDTISIVPYKTWL